MTIFLPFRQCEYCEVGNVIIQFSTSLMPKKAFQITRLWLMIWKTFSAIVMWKTQYSQYNLITIMGSILGFLYHCYAPHFGNGSSTYRGAKLPPSGLTVSYQIVHTIFPYFVATESWKFPFHIAQKCMNQPAITC